MYRSRSHYGWCRDDECNMLTERMHLIQCKGLPIWPPPRHLDWMGKKVADSMMLGLIADESGRPHPSTNILTLNTLTKDGIPSDTVLKRGNSDCGTHVLFPSCCSHWTRSVTDLKGMSPYGEVWLL